MPAQFHSLISRTQVGSQRLSVSVARQAKTSHGERLVHVSTPVLQTMIMQLPHITVTFHTGARWSTCAACSVCILCAEMVSGGAAAAAMHEFEKHQEHQGKQVHHGFGKVHGAA